MLKDISTELVYVSTVYIVVCWPHSNVTNSLAAHIRLGGGGGGGIFNM